MSGFRGDNPWKPEELEWLRENFTIKSWPEILAGIPGRSRSGIEQKAYSLGYKRPAQWEPTLANDPVIRELREKRKAMGLSLDAVCILTDCQWPSLVSKYERGQIRPLFSTVRDWAQALGFNIVLEPIGYREMVRNQQRKALPKPVGGKANSTIREIAE